MPLSDMHLNIISDKLLYRADPTMFSSSPSDRNCIVSDIRLKTLSNLPLTPPRQSSRPARSLQP